MLIPFKTGEKIVERYYYMFTYREIERLAHKAGFEILSLRRRANNRFPVRNFSRNICLLLKKTN
jgi:hypothetical protein